MSLVDRVRALLGDDAVDVAATPDGVPRVAPGSPDAVGLLLGTAREEGWRVRVEGAGTWLPADAPADLALTTRRLDKIPAIEPQDLSATAEAGIGCDLLRQQLADRGTWLALDPPGLAGRTLGSVVATATAGPLRHGFGAVRDHLLGVTFVTGDGRLVQSGGRVMKNVAGYDLTKLAAGGFGAFGVIVLVHLRLRALPRADQTLVLEGSREDLTQVADDIAAAVETLPVCRQREIQLARQVRPQTARVDAARASLQRPALRRRPDEASLQTRMAVEQIGIGAAECETVLAERPVHLQRHRGQTGHAADTARMDAVRQCSLEREVARRAAYDVGADEGPAEVAPASMQAQPRPVRHDADAAGAAGVGARARMRDLHLPGG